MEKILPFQRFGRLVVIESVGNKWQFLCRCDCGNEKVIYGGNLRKGVTQSCGCLRKERQREANTTHGLSNNPLYQTWKRMMDRCYNPNNHRYHDYGNRGIYVCDRWLSLQNFIEDNEGCKKNGLTLDRINNDGPYSPENCKWSSQHTQSRNKRSNHFLTFNNETLTVMDWSKRIGLRPHSLSTRLSRGWSIEEALTTPPHTRIH